MFEWGKIFSKPVQCESTRQSLPASFESPAPQAWGQPPSFRKLIKDQ